MRIKLLTSDLSDQLYVENAKRFLAKNLLGQDIEFVESDPDAFYITSGGVESYFKETILNRPFYLTIVYDGGNSFAAAMEIKAYLKKKNINFKIVKDNEISKIVPMYNEILQGLAKLKGQNIALVGEMSPWLLNSDISNKYLQEKFDITLKKISWETILSKYQKTISMEFIEEFGKLNNLISKEELEKSSTIFTILKNMVDEYNLSAISVECFSLLKKLESTGCLALSYLNDLKIVAGCEGDLANTVSMLLCKEICNIIPWMANLHDLKECYFIT